LARTLTVTTELSFFEETKSLKL